MSPPQLDTQWKLGAPAVVSLDVCRVVQALPSGDDSTRIVLTGVGDVWVHPMQSQAPSGAAHCAPSQAQRIPANAPPPQSLSGSVTVVPSDIRPANGAFT